MKLKEAIEKIKGDEYEECYTYDEFLVCSCGETRLHSIKIYNYSIDLFNTDLLDLLDNEVELDEEDLSITHTINEYLCDVCIANKYPVKEAYHCTNFLSCDDVAIGETIRLISSKRGRYGSGLYVVGKYSERHKPEKEYGKTNIVFKNINITCHDIYSGYATINAEHIDVVIKNINYDNQSIIVEVLNKKIQNNNDNWIYS